MPVTVEADAAALEGPFSVEVALDESGDGAQAIDLEGMFAQIGATPESATASDPANEFLFTVSGTT